ncbi:LytTR family DNA-binding domain-containing protein [Pedobacter heparinus]|uniref:LytR/AlgR family response regulator transcription factor n=1 Tax=Pedobacter heparinus TaxID=984 RepID=UPI00292E285E|nr:LytTR family DNA-binding domain-containing protein [Pedobacter heparinus]
MSKYQCLIVDDEPIARDIVERYCSHMEHLHIVSSCGNALEARSVLQSQQIDILLLDINMPVIDGISFARTLKGKTELIFTTAYKEFATDAFDLNACDYLLKPFSFDRFIIAIDKAVERLQTKPLKPQSATGLGESKPAEDYIFLKTNGKVFKIMHAELLYAEAQGNYTKIVTTKGTFGPKMPFSGLEELLPAFLFLRVHRSFLVNKSMISHIEGNRIFINQTEIPIGSIYKEAMLKELGL